MSFGQVDASLAEGVGETTAHRCKAEQQQLKNLNHDDEKTFHYSCDAGNGRNNQRCKRHQDLPWQQHLCRRRSVHDRRSDTPHPARRHGNDLTIPTAIEKEALTRGLFSMFD